MTSVGENTVKKNEVITGYKSKKVVVVFIRWILVIATAYLILVSNGGGGNLVIARTAVLLLIVSNLILYLMPARFFYKEYFDAVLLLTDIALVTCSVWLTGRVEGDFYLLYFLIIMIASVSETFKSLIWSAFLVAAIYLSMLFSRGAITEATIMGVLIRVPFFFIVAIFYGYFAQLVRAERDARLDLKKQLGIATKLRHGSYELAGSLDRETILRTLVSCQLEFCQAKFAAIVSRGKSEVLVSDSIEDFELDYQRLANIFDAIARRSSGEELTSENMPSVVSTFDDDLSGSQSGAAIKLDDLTLLPLTNESDADLYLILKGKFSNETLEYARLLLLSATMSLSNAGQYQELVHEVEKRLQVSKQLGVALQFKSQFLANVSHEIRTPIYSLLGFTELLLESGYGELEEEQRAAVKRIAHNANSLLEMINQILDLSKLEAGKSMVNPKLGNLGEFLFEIEESCKPLIKNDPISFKVDVEESFPEILIDWTLLRQITLNLVSNAIKFTEKGEICISATFDLSSETFDLSIRDSGIGIKEEQVSQIFEPFQQLDNSYTKRFAGTGLGLALTKKHVELLGGDVKVRSKFNKGSTFTISLPLFHAPQLGTAPQPSA